MEVLKILTFFPSVVAKHELQSLFTQSLSLYDCLLLPDFYYFLFLLFVADQEKGAASSSTTVTNGSGLMEDKKLVQKVNFLTLTMK